MPWTRDRLLDLARDRFQDTLLVVVANREPYAHGREEGRIRWIRPASGLVTALDPVMRACGGVWVGHGSGDADRETADACGRLPVPPDDPSYMLRRVWLTREEEEGYYYGFANEAIWPLCHIAFTRPNFKTSDWKQYERVNRKFATAVLEEIEGRRAIVFVQDYHYALLPRMIKDQRPDAVVCQFWHIPWPNREAFRICPWGAEILYGLLGNDLLGFHLQYHCLNFLETVDRTLEARVEYDHSTVTHGGKPTIVRPFPISIDPETAKSNGTHPCSAVFRTRRRLRLRDEKIILGVDRLDYTKGIPERLKALDRFLQKYPEYRERVVFVQVGAPSRTHIPRYRALDEEIDDLVEGINWRHETDSWRPILYLSRHHSAEEILPLYRAAQVCVVSSLHDGMNLVAKEFVAAREDLRGVLVLSRFTGAAREMSDALLINPFATEEFADTLHLALSMAPEEQERRMQRLREQVSAGNVYRWAGTLLTEASRLAEVIV